MRKKELHVNQRESSISRNIDLLLLLILLFYFSYLELEEKYPKIDGRFLDISLQGFCLDSKGKPHSIDKDLITSKYS